MDLSAPTDSAGAGTSQATIKQLEVPTKYPQILCKCIEAFMLNILSTSVRQTKATAQDVQSHKLNSISQIASLSLQLPLAE